VIDEAKKIEKGSPVVQSQLWKGLRLCPLRLFGVHDEEAEFPGKMEKLD
jgi:hypothetical protein